MFSWGRENKVEEKKTETPITYNLELEDLDSIKEKVAVMCMKKCLNDPDEPALTAGQRVCLSRCTYKVASSLGYMNKLYGHLELKVDRFQQTKALEDSNTTN